MPITWNSYRPLGRARVTVSPLCLGTMNLGSLVEDAQSLAILDTAFAGGITFIDTANIYGKRNGKHARGRTEEIIGTWLAATPGRRDQIVLATKAGWYTGPGHAQDGLSAYHLRHAVDASLRRLQTDRIDVFYLHRVDPLADIDETWQALAQLIQSGKILYVATSNCAGWNLVEHEHAARRHQLRGPVVDQPRYSLVQRGCEADLVPAAQQHGIGLVPYAPLGDGLLGSPLRGGGGRTDAPELAALRDRLKPQLEAFAALATELSTSPAALAIAWLMHRSSVIAPIIGPRTVEQLNDALGTVDLKLEPETLQRLDQLFPGPTCAPASYKDFA